MLRPTAGSAGADVLLLSRSKGANPNVRGRPQIAGGTIRTDTGQILRLGRVNSSSSLAVAQQPATWQAARELGLNGIRFGYKVGAKSWAQVFDDIDAVVEAARNNRCYVMLGNPEFAPGTFDDDLTGNTPVSVANWTQLAPRYANEPHVIYEMINEPEAWGVWSNYVGPGPGYAPKPLMLALHDIYEVMRAGAPDTMICVPTPANIQDSAGTAHYVSVIDSFNALGGVDWTKTAWSFHYYNKTLEIGVNNNSAIDGGVAGLTWLRTFYPIICTETNWWMEVGRAPLIDGLDAMEMAQVGWTLMSYPGQIGPHDFPFAGDLYDTTNGYLINKVNQLRARGFSIPVE